MEINDLVMSVQGLVYKMAADFDRKGLVGDDKAVTKDDLIQAGFEGALSAAHMFDPKRGVQYITYAYPSIYRHMEHEVRRLGGPLTIPHIKMHYVISVVAEERAEWMQKYGELPAVDELCSNENLLQKIRAHGDYSHIPQETLEAHIQDAVMYLENGQAVSFDSVEADNEETLEDIYPDESPEIDPVQMYEAQEISDQLSVALQELPYNERTVLEYRFGLKDGKEWTLRGIARKMSVSHEVVRKWENRGLQMLRRMPERFRLRELL